jgi:hypothetical protein
MTSPTLSFVGLAFMGLAKPNALWIITLDAGGFHEEDDSDPFRVQLFFRCVVRGNCWRCHDNEHFSSGAINAGHNK